MNNRFVSNYLFGNRRVLSSSQLGLLEQTSQPLDTPQSHLQNRSMNSVYEASQPHQSLDVPRSNPGPVTSLSYSNNSHLMSGPPRHLRQPSIKALILQQEHHRAARVSNSTIHSSLLSRTTSDMGSHVTPLEAAAALQERSHSLRIMEPMCLRSSTGHTMSVKATAKLKKKMDDATQVVRTLLSPKLLKDQSIPYELLAEAYGLVFVTMYKAGFMFTGKIGTGFVVSRTTGGWSAPSFVKSGGFGFGMMAGGEVVNYIIILNSMSAVKVFTRNGQVQLGSELDIAVGPIGRAASASLNVGPGDVAPNYSYSHSKGLYGGIGLSGALICTRKSLNATCYGAHVTARQLLGGEVACPLAEPLWKALDEALSIRREYRNGFPVLAPAHTGMACNACGQVLSSESYGTACANCGNLLVYSVGVHSGRRYTSEFVASALNHRAG